MSDCRDNFIGTDVHHDKPSRRHAVVRDSTPITLARASIQQGTHPSTFDALAFYRDASRISCENITGCS
jgi:hypothetical protein